MKAVIQRVVHASVSVEGRITAQIDAGALVLLGVSKEDEDRDALYMVEKIQTLRMFSDPQGKMNLSIMDIGGGILVVSQFTLLGDTRKGRRPGFDQAADPDRARALYEQVVEGLKGRGIPTQEGVFGAYMQVILQNDGPVTFVLDSRGGS
ncbi:MAG: D-aminoacyl-tRNA deacylase [Nitrospiraceae bacterium]